MQQPARHIIRLPAFLLVLALLAACGQSLPQAPIAGASPKPTLAPPINTSSPPVAPSPSLSPASYFTDFSDATASAPPPDFVDVKSEGPTPDWVYAGDWHRAIDENGQPTLLQDQIRSATGVTYLRYRGNALGLPNGQMPPTYYAEVVVRPLDSPYNYPPTGDQGTPFYYINAATYLEVVIKPTLLEIWEANGAAPHTSQGWQRLWHENLTTNAGEQRRVGALVDVPHGTFTAYLDGVPQGSAQSALLRPQPAYVALRAIGNKVSFADFRIEAR